MLININLYLNGYNSIRSRRYAVISLTRSLWGESRAVSAQVVSACFYTLGNIPAYNDLGICPTIYV